MCHKFNYRAILCQLWFVLASTSLLVGKAHAQTKLDTLWERWTDIGQPDTVRIKALDTFTLEHIFIKPDTGIHYAKMMFDFAEKIESISYQVIALYRQGVAYYYLRDYEAAYSVGERCLELAKISGNTLRISHALNLFGIVSLDRGDYQKAIEVMSEALEIAERIDDTVTIASMLNNIGLIYKAQKNGPKARQYIEPTIRIFSDLGAMQEVAETKVDIGDTYFFEEIFETALAYYEEGFAVYDSINHERGRGSALNGIGNARSSMGQYPAALKTFEKALAIFQRIDDPFGNATSFLGLGVTYQKMGKFSLSIANCLKAYSGASEIENLVEQKDACICLYEGYKKLGNYKVALKYHEILTGLENDQQLVETDKKLQQLQFARTRLADSLQYAKAVDLKDLRIENQAVNLSRQRWGLFSAVGLLLLTSLLAVAIFRGKRRSDELAEERRQKAQLVEKQSRDLKASLVQVQEKNQEILQAQEQIIQQEKLASLGQVTAGIAHEIKNPLNFITNFAEGSLELHEELDMQFKEAPKSDPSEEISEIVEELKQNAKDIHEHGLRADRIVASMLDHLRRGKGETQLIALNDLVEENVKLAYHSYRGLHPNFEVDIELNLVHGQVRVSAHATDLGRALVNILSNSFYALVQKRKIESGYAPKMKVTTNVHDDKVQIKIYDNGLGISTAVRHQIFEPFFTTKPSNQPNPGLGLFVAHDIIVKSHGGELEVTSEEGCFTEFTITLICHSE